ncbi:MAG TPA: GntR family transcriptional regulator [Acidimicrobiales bacterium]|nr:GntR family transcriptional regulator [Acidimicrobiales bacterium]
MSTHPASPPAYRRVADELRALLTDPAGPQTKLPTEADLCRTYHVSRQTARRAYQELVAEGLVERVPGRGSFPAPRSPYMRSFGSIEDLMALSSDTIMEVVEPLALGPASARARADLGSDVVWHLAIRRLTGDAPFVYTEICLPRALGVKLRRTFLSRAGARRRTTVLQLLEPVLDGQIVSALQEVTVDRLPPSAAEQIDMAAGRPALRIDRRYLDGRSTPVESTTSWFNPNRYAYRLELRRSGAHRPQ